MGVEALTETAYNFDQPNLYPPGVLNSGNLRGIMSEYRVASILRKHPDVRRTYVTGFDSADNHNLVDVVVLMKPQSFIARVDVQVKASNVQIPSFRKRVGRILRELGKADNCEARDVYLLERGLMVIVGGVRVTEGLRKKEEVSDDSIMDSFKDQLEMLERYYQRKRTLLDDHPFKFLNA